MSVELFHYFNQNMSEQLFWTQLYYIKPDINTDKNVKQSHSSHWFFCFGNFIFLKFKTMNFTLILKKYFYYYLHELTVLKFSVLISNTVYTDKCNPHT